MVPGADPNKRGVQTRDPFGLSPRSSPLPDPLRLAVETRNLELVELLCKKSADVSSVDHAEDGETKKTSVLVKAVSVGDIKVVRLLLDYGAQDGPFCSALYVAATLAKSTLKAANGSRRITLHDNASNAEVVPAASANGAHPKNPEALRHELLTALLDAGISTNKLSNTKPPRTALFAAAQQGDLATVNLLIQYGAVYPFGHVPGTTNTDATPLTVAVQGGHLEVVKALLDAGESVSVRCAVDLRGVRTFYGGLYRLRRLYGDGVVDGVQWLTPLQMALLGPPEMRSKNEIVKLLLEARADVDPPSFLPASAERPKKKMLLKKSATTKRLSPVLLAAILPSEFTFSSMPTVWQEQLEVFRTLWQHGAQHGAQPFGHGDSLYRTAADFFVALLRHDLFMATSATTTPERTDNINTHRWQQLVRIAHETGGMSDPQTLFLRLLAMCPGDCSQPCSNGSTTTTALFKRVDHVDGYLLRKRRLCVCALNFLLQLSEESGGMIDTGAALRHCARFGQLDAVQMLLFEGPLIVGDHAKMLTSCDSGGRTALHEVGQFLTNTMQLLAPAHRSTLCSFT